MISGKDKFVSSVNCYGGWGTQSNSRNEEILGIALVSEWGNESCVLTEGITCNLFGEE